MKSVDFLYSIRMLSAFVNHRALTETGSVYGTAFKPIRMLFSSNSATYKIGVSVVSSFCQQI